MLLAGFVGSVAVELFPLEKVSEFEFGIWSLITVGAVGTFLPVPIAFDVVVAFLLFNAGLPIGLSMTLLFTLGIFSFYPLPDHRS